MLHTCCLAPNDLALYLISCDYTIMTVGGIRHQMFGFYSATLEGSKFARALSLPTKIREDMKLI